MAQLSTSSPEQSEQRSESLVYIAVSDWEPYTREETTKLEAFEAAEKQRLGNGLDNYNTLTVLKKANGTWSFRRKLDPDLTWSKPISSLCELLVKAAQ